MCNHTLFLYCQGARKKRGADRPRGSLRIFRLPDGKGEASPAGHRPPCRRQSGDHALPSDPQVISVVNSEFEIVLNFSLVI